MSLDNFERQLDWVSRLRGEKKLMAGAIVSWQAVSTTINELIQHFNNILFCDQVDNKCHRIVQMQKLIVGSLYELDNFLDRWALLLHDRKNLTEDIIKSKKAFKTHCRVIGLDQTMKLIRNNVAFHFAESLGKPDEMISMYRCVERLELDQVKAIWKTAFTCGELMKNSSVALCHQ